MSERPTPETDYEQKIDNGDTRPLLSFARRLERERDEARELARELRHALALSLPHLEAIVAHNEAVNGCESRMDRADLIAVESALTKAREVLP